MHPPISSAVLCKSKSLQQIDKLNHLQIYKLKLYWIVNHIFTITDKQNCIESAADDSFPLENPLFQGLSLESKKVCSGQKPSKPGQIMGHFLASFRPTFTLFSSGSGSHFCCAFPALNKKIWFAHLLYAPIKFNLLLNKDQL